MQLIINLLKLNFMEKIITEKIKTVYTCYEDCAENIVYFCGVPVMKAFMGFYESSSKPCYCYTYPHGGSIPNMRQMTREKYLEEIERLKSYNGKPSDFPFTANL